jgi:hypothetical protein
MSNKEWDDDIFCEPVPVHIHMVTWVARKKESLQIASVELKTLFNNQRAFPLKTIQSQELISSIVEIVQNNFFK